MRILMLASSYPKFQGDVTAPFVESIASAIAAQGHEVHILLPEHRDLRRAPVENGVHIHTYHYAPRPEWTQWGYAESLRADVKIKRGMYALAPLVFFAALEKLNELTAREQFDVIHAHWVLPNAPMAALAAQRRGLPLAVSLHGSDVFVAEKIAALGATARWCLNRADAITACSDDLLNRALALGAPESRTELIPYGADVKAFHVNPSAAQDLRRRLNLNADDLLILGVGRMVYKKGFDYLIQAMPAVLEQAPHARLVLAGYGDLRADLEQHSQALGLNSHVIFAGRVPRPEIPVYFAAADIVAAPSVRDDAGNVDGLPNVALEAMAAGKPLVASNIAGLTDLVRDGKSGLLVEEKNPRALADAILTLARDAELRARFGDAGRAFIHAELSWDHVAQKFIAMYGRISAHGERARRET